METQALCEVSKHVVFFGLYFPVLSPNAGKYGPEKTPYLETFLAVKMFWNKVISKHKNKYPTKLFSNFI